MSREDTHGQKAGRGVRWRAGKVSRADVVDVSQKAERFEDKLKDVPGSLGKMIMQLRLLFEMIRDYVSGTYARTPWFTIATATASVLYFLTPLDLVPDFIPLIGYIDDAMVIAFALKGMRGELRKYCQFKGYDPEEYF